MQAEQKLRQTVQNLRYFTDFQTKIFAEWNVFHNEKTQQYKKSYNDCDRFQKSCVQPEHFYTNLKKMNKTTQKFNFHYFFVVFVVTIIVIVGISIING